jgi:hypothetical protein
VKKFFKIFFLIIFFGDILVLNYFVFFKKVTPPSPIINKCDCPAPICDCVVPTTAPTTATAPASKIIVPTAKKSKTVTYIPITGTGSTTENKWVDVAGTDFYFNPSDYTGLKEAYFEANIKLFNGNGLVFTRLFDATAGIEVWGSEVQTNSQTAVSLTSQKLTLRDGNHLYRVQIKSLTADTAIYNSGRVKLVQEN